MLDHCRRFHFATALYEKMNFQFQSYLNKKPVRKCERHDGGGTLIFPVCVLKLENNPIEFHMGDCQNYGPTFWIPIILRHLIFRVPRRDHHFDNHPYNMDLTW